MDIDAARAQLARRGAGPQSVASTAPGARLSAACRPGAQDGCANPVPSLTRRRASAARRQHARQTYKCVGDNTNRKSCGAQAVWGRAPVWPTGQCRQQVATIACGRAPKCAIRTDRASLVL